MRAGSGYSQCRIRAMVRIVTASAVLLCAGLASPARAQDAMTKEAAAAVKAAFLADVETVRGKFVGLAQAFPQDKYGWRPMEGVRSVSEVLMLAASEGYGFIPTGFGGKAALAREEVAGVLLAEVAQLVLGAQH